MTITSQNCGYLDKLLPGNTTQATKDFTIKEAVRLCVAVVNVPALEMSMRFARVDGIIGWL